MLKSIVGTLFGAFAGYWAGGWIGPPDPKSDPRAETELRELRDAHRELQHELRSSRLLNATILRAKSNTTPPDVAKPEIAAETVRCDEVAQANDQLHENEEDLPHVLRRDDLDLKLEDAPADQQWQTDVDQATKRVLSDFPQAEVIDTRCSSQLCRVEFTTGSGSNSVDAIMDRLNSMPAVTGERLIQVDDSTDPPFATAYFGRDGAISLMPSPPDG